jgi:hypothetical protein
VLFIDHEKAKDCEEQILDVNAVPAAFSKGLLAQPHPGSVLSNIVPIPMDASQAGGGGTDCSDASDDEVAEAADRGKGDGMSKL